jgi:hypothetical protein
VAGKARAREGLQRVLFEREQHAATVEDAAGMLTNWRKAASRYRQLLKADERRGEVERETAMAETQPLSEAQLLRKRVRHFTDGLVIGTKRFVDEVFAATRDYFGPRRKSGARRIRHVETSLCAMRDLSDPSGGNTA